MPDARHRLVDRTGRETDRLRRGDDVRSSSRQGRADWEAGGERGAPGQRHVPVARRDLQKRCTAGRPACRGPRRTLLPHRPLLRGRPRSPRGDGAAEGRRHDLAHPLSGPDGHCRAGRDAGPSAAERDAAVLGYFKSRKTLGKVIHRFFSDPGLLVAGACLAGPERQGRHYAAARAAHRSRFRTGAERRGAGGTRSSGRSPAGLHLLHRPPRAGV